MFDVSKSQRSRLGAVLVFFQFALLCALAALAAPRLMRGDTDALGIVLAVLSVALGVWTLAHNRLGNFNIHPAPKISGVLVTSGPYRWIRHPMYSAVLLAGAAMASIATGVVAWLAWLALFLVLWVKALLEERWVGQLHGAYADYCRQSKRFIPWIF